MKLDQIQIELEAYASIAATLEAGRRCQELHERAGLPMPPRIQWLLGISPPPNGAPGPENKANAHIPAPDHLNRPAEAGSEWISIRVSDAIVTTVVLAILRAANGEPVRSRDVTDRVMELLPNSTSGSVANAGTRLSTDEVIARSEDGWKLVKPEKAAIMQDGLLWGPIGIFAQQDIAAYRRDAILHVLKHFPKGLQVVQIVEQLRSCQWLHTAANKDILKLDMQVLMVARKVRRTGNPRKWQLAPPEKAE